MSLVIACIILTGNFGTARFVTGVCIMLDVAVVVRWLAMPYMVVATMVVDIWSAAPIVIVPSRVVAPVPRRMPADIPRSPPIVEDVWAYNISRNNDIVRTINVRVANYCDGS